MDTLEYYWSIALEEGFVNVSLWTIDADRVRIIATVEQESWENQEDLVLALNNLLEKAVKDYPEDAKEPEKTVFGVAPGWVTDGQIKKEKLKIIRHLCTKLKLSPSGFVVLPEAIAHGTKHNEGSPLNSLVVGLGQEELDLSLFNLGNLVGTVEVGRSENLLDDINEGLARFKTGQHLPSRFIVYGGEDKALEETIQQLIAHDWESSDSAVKFMHTPKFESVDSKNQSIFTALAGASEIVDVSELVYENKEETKQPQTTEEGQTKEIGEENDNITSSEVSPEEIGFVLGGDIEEQKEISQQNNINDAEETEFIRDQQVQNRKNKFRFNMPKIDFLKKIKLPKLKFKPSARSSHGPSLSRQKLPKESSFKRAFFILLIFIILVGFGLFAAWWYLPKAKVTIYVAPRSLRETKEVVMGDDVETDFENLTLRANSTSLEESGERTTSTTGTKVVGEKATGKVTIRNGTSTGIKLKAGTILKGSSDLLFTLDNEASISAATSPSEPGSATLAVSAESIGEEYNIDKDSTFSVSNYPTSEVDAVADTEFTGGSSREITAVSQVDLDKLEEELIDQLKEEGRSKIKEQIGSNEELIDGSIQIEDIESDFNHKVGDEASTVKLNATVKFTALTVNKDSLFNLAKDVLGSTIPDGYALKDNQLDLSYDLVSEEDGKFYFDIQFEANLLPQINIDEIASKISGRYPPQAYEYLSTVPGFVRADLGVKPVLPGKLAIMPHVRKNIEIGISAAR